MQHSLSYWTWCHLHIQGVFLTGTPPEFEVLAGKNNFEKNVRPCFQNDLTDARLKPKDPVFFHSPKSQYHKWPACGQDSKCFWPIVGIVSLHQCLSASYENLNIEKVFSKYLNFSKRTSSQLADSNPRPLLHSKVEPDHRKIALL